MKIYLVRHGDSVSMADDDRRPLSEKGIDEINQLVKLISPLHIRVKQILHSNKLRAKQTAEILSQSVHMQNPLEERMN